MLERDLGSLRYLVVDDEPFARSTAALSLRTLGSEAIFLAENGREAMDFLNSEATRIDIVISDIRMPSTHGLRLLKQIRAGHTKAPRDLKFAMFSGHTERRLIGLALALDVDSIMAKPASVDTMRRHLSRMAAVDYPVGAAPGYDILEVDRPIRHLLNVAMGRHAPSGINAKTMKLLRPKWRSEPEDEAPREPEIQARKVTLGEAEPGMVLARAVTGPDGVLLLSEGTELSRRYISRLQDAALVGAPISHLWVTDGDLALRAQHNRNRTRRLVVRI